ncbi:PREDICTED: multivesicular body subunit 12A [Nicrophorus vespilloides]|uniref:Multivesicular body subunit 12A n=1 Tax=Nicrophorus vespilloides TaxID=110193 RepID=A0ABM1M9H9_NICVS|nr:PREDICTED: multivesicular body subunit 12A [Nicrophorus vespilloides]XP_017771222.1 PREDICTED: multivesicular body subunit 12A [Nicrophorus vespilloides]XP_017771223.1 PREDICTED: multivesicular body subunit 12A [Nicrophorus vespilloides]XP_017771224.1 PREDICTED: multivesicular body subunit 12A [Nicrophorus vespilloides]XP_017771225.1 PREDICTED: multivesicular body subunit 12A [Nicrophorus vespilloides]XP_017771226.1 PREDICTED: multivesicular body subunit 12A [Nicrophorus vespilloides]XP_01
MSKRKSNNIFLFDSLSKTLPDDRPITSLQIIENLERCPPGFYAISKTHDQDQDADLWREGSSFLKKKSIRYLCISKTEGLPDFVLKELSILNEKSVPSEGYSLLNRTADSEQKAWRKKQLCYKLVPKYNTQLAITDIIVCSRLKKAPDGFVQAGDLNGLLICYKMGNIQTSNPSPSQSNGVIGHQKRGGAAPPPPLPPKGTSMYPDLSDGDGDYEILNPIQTPSRPAPLPPSQYPLSPPLHVQNHPAAHNTIGSTSNYAGLEGVPFALNPKFGNGSADKIQLPIVKSRKMSELMRDYNYDFRLERTNVN